MNSYKIDVLEVDQRKAELERKFGKALVVPAQLNDPHSLIAREKNPG